MNTEGARQAHADLNDLRPASHQTDPEDDRRAWCEAINGLDDACQKVADLTDHLAAG